MGKVRWLGGVVVRVLDSRSADRGFDSRPWHCRAMTLGKLFTPLFTKQCQLVPCEGFHVNTPHVAAGQWHGSNEQGEYCSKQFSSDQEQRS